MFTLHLKTSNVNFDTLVSRFYQAYIVDYVMFIEKGVVYVILNKWNSWRIYRT